VIAADWYAWALISALGVYTIYALVFLWGLRATPHTPASDHPCISVIIAARNEAGNIGNLLTDLAAQTWPEDRREVILVDDGSTDNTAHIAEAAGVRVLRIEEVPKNIAPKKYALEQGIAASTGDIILTTDADCRVKPGWMAAMARCFDDRTGIVAGFSETEAQKSQTAAWERIDFLAMMAVAAGAVGAGIPMAASGQNLAYRRTAWEDINGFGDQRHRPSGDDVLLMQRIVRRTAWKARFCRAPESFVTTRPCENLAALLRQRIRWASNAAAFSVLAPYFTAYLVDTWLVALLLIGGGVTWLAGLPVGIPLIAACCWKIGIDGAILWRSATIFGTRQTLRAFPLWSLTVPLYIVGMGFLGPLGKFQWKGRTFC